MPRLKTIERMTGEKFYAAVELGGGTLINNKFFIDKFRCAQANGYPTFVFGSGVRNPLYWTNEKKERNLLPEWIECLNKAFYVGVRGPLSRAILAEHGFDKAEVIGDPALSWGRGRVRPKHRTKRLGINFGVSEGNVWGNEKGIFTFIAGLTRALQDKGWEVTYIPVWKQDLPIIEETARRNKSVRIFHGYASLRKTLDILESCDAFIGQKLHSVILAMCVYTPSIMLEYRPKCLDFMLSMGMQDFNVRTDRLSTEHILGLLDRLAEDSSGIQKRLWENVQSYKALQKQRAQSILAQIHAGNFN